MQSRRAIIFLAITAFLSTMGIGIVAPVLPFIVQHYLPSQQSLAVWVGVLASVYALCQFLAAPGLGVLSDRYGRRPLLLICLLGSAFGYALFGLGGALWVLLLGRIIDGLTGGNFSIVFAYIADISEPEERAKYFGLFGAAAGAGFILGPAIGGLASHLGDQVPVYLAAVLTLANLLWGCAFLPESLSREHRSQPVSRNALNPFAQLWGLLKLPRLRWLLLAIFLAGMPFAALQSNGVVLIKDSLHWNADAIGAVFSVLGVVTILVQGFLIRWLLPRYGEKKLMLAGLACESIAYVLFGALAFAHSPLIVFAGIAIFALGDGLLDPSIPSVISQAAGVSDQGLIQGGTQSIQSLTIILGSLLAGELYHRLGHASPYWLGVVAVGLAIVATSRALSAASPLPAREGAGG